MPAQSSAVPSSTRCAALLEVAGELGSRAASARSARRRSAVIPTWDLLHRIGPDWRCIFVGDAAMSPYELVQPGAFWEKGSAPFRAFASAGRSGDVRLFAQSEREMPNARTSTNLRRPARRSCRHQG